MELKDMIYKRKSTRSFSAEEINADVRTNIMDFISELKPLCPCIKTRFEIIGYESVKCILPWKAPHYLAVFSEDNELDFENVGFMLQQLDLYLQSLGLGVCWLGMGKFNPSVEDKSDGLKFVIMLAFGKPEGKIYLRKNISEFKRKTLHDISDTEDERLEPARLAPSSVNSQPWYFTHDGNSIHTYCVKQGLFKKMALGKFNRIDIGIALAHMYIANPDTFSFSKEDSPKELKGYSYIGSFTV